MSDTSDFSEMSGEEDEGSQDETKSTPQTAAKQKVVKRKLRGSDLSDDSGGERGEKVHLVDANGVSFPVRNPFAKIKNKEVRQKRFKKMKADKNKEKKMDRKQRKKEGGERSTGHTIESLRETDHTTVQDLDDSENEEIRKDLETDEFSAYYSQSYEPKVLITFADNPVTKTRMFGRELRRMIPNSIAKIRNRSSMKNLCKSAIREDFTDLIVINEDRRQPNGMVVVHLPNGPTAHFRISNVKLTKDLKRDYREISQHRPEVVLTNFTTRLGLNVGRMLGALFHFDPEFRGRRAVTFHNQRDYIFFRHHRYEFTKEGQKVKLRELGPRFTLKLRSIQAGLFDSKSGDYEWIITNKRHAMEGRRRFFL